MFIIIFFCMHIHDPRPSLIERKNGAISVERARRKWIKLKYAARETAAKMPPMSPKCTTRNPKQNNNNNLANCLSPLTH